MGRKSTPVEVHCATCSKTIVTLPHVVRTYTARGLKFYCSLECRRTGWRVDVTCGTCGKTFRKLASHAKRSANHYCDVDCAKQATRRIEFSKRRNRAPFTPVKIDREAKDLLEVLGRHHNLSQVKTLRKIICAAVSEISTNKPAKIT